MLAKDDSLLRTAFAETIDILTEASGHDLGWLKPLIDNTPNELMQKAMKRTLAVSTEQLLFIIQQGFLSKNEFGTLSGARGQVRPRFSPA